jgi:hypothetical protein
MKQSIGLASLVVREYDEAIVFYVGTLTFALIEYTYIKEQDKRWPIRPKALLSCASQTKSPTGR